MCQEYKPSSSFGHKADQSCSSQKTQQVLAQNHQKPLDGFTELSHGEIRPFSNFNPRSLNLLWDWEVMSGLVMTKVVCS